MYIPHRFEVKHLVMNDHNFDFKDYLPSLKCSKALQSGSFRYSKTDAKDKLTERLGT